MILASSSFVAVAQSVTDKPRVGLLLSADKKHHDEFNGALASLGWEAERIPSTLENMEALPDRLGEFDILIAAPLFNIGKTPVSDEAKAKYKKFLENGGMIAITDGSYDGPRLWLEQIDASFGGLTNGKCNSSQWSVKGATTDPAQPHPLRFFPSPITEPNSWPHFHDVDSKSKWAVVARCSEGNPVTFAQQVGKGLVSISALRQPSDKQLGNFYACLMLARGGIDLLSFHLPDPAIGKETLRLELNLSAGSAPGSFIYEITPQGGTPQQFEKKVTGGVFELPYEFTQRGAAQTRLLFKRGEQQAVLFSREVVIPELLTVTPNAYRGILSTERRLPEVRFGIKLAPDKEKLAGAKVTLQVLNPQGSPIAEAVSSLKEDHPLDYWQPVALKQNLPAGEYKVRATLSQGGKNLALSEAPIHLLAPREAQTIVDEDNTLLVNGKPFFPLGIYHVEPKFYETIASLGMNTVQFWTWHGRSGLDQAQQHGLKAVFELNHKGEKIVQDTVAAHGEHPAILMWYGMDEPAEGSYHLAQTLNRAYNAEDLQHPTYMVSCRPDVFREQSAFANVFAVDPYGAPSIVNNWLDKANTAVDRRKAVICVPASFGYETEEELRACAYTALAHDARGIIWYPWAQAGGGPIGVGLNTNEANQAVVKAICAEINALYPALTSPHRVPFVSQDKRVQGLYCKVGNSHYLILVNSSEEPSNGRVVIPNEPGLTKELTDFFEKSKDRLSIRQGAFNLKLNPLETRVYFVK